MIGCKQIKPEMALSVSQDANIAEFRQSWMPVIGSTWLVPWIMFFDGKFSKCYGLCSVGTFTADIYVNGVKFFTVTQAANVTPVNLLSGTGAFLAGEVVTCEVVSASADASGIYILCTS